MDKKVERVIERLKEENKAHRIKILGDKENKANAFAILAHSNIVVKCLEEDKYNGLDKRTLNSLEEAGIEFEVLE